VRPIFRLSPLLRNWGTPTGTAAPLAELFPFGAHDDQADAASLALAKLTAVKPASVLY
jgi:hypothetical protein